MVHLFRTAAAVWLAAAFAGPAAAQAPSWRMQYRCDDGSRLAVSFDHEASPSMAWIGHGGLSAGLTASTDPSVYTAARWTLRTSGNQAALENTGAGPRHCTGDGPLQRLVVDRETRLRLALPASWLSQRYLVHLVRGADAQVLFPAAELVVVVEYQPQAPSLRSHPLLQLVVLPPQRWQALQQRPKQMPLQRLGQEFGRVYGAALDGQHPYPAGSADAQTFEVMRAALAEPPQDLQSSFGWLGVDEGGRRATLAGRLAWRGRPALKRGDELVVQLLDTSRPDAGAAVLAEQRMPASRDTPGYALQYEAGQIDPRGRYAIVARVVRDGRLRYATEGAQPALTRGAAARPRVMLTAARGTPAPAEGGLVCQGHEPDWSLRLWDSRSTLQGPTARPLQLRGAWERIDHLQPRVAVWRGAPATARTPLVAMLSQEHCVDAMGEEGEAPSSHRAVVSLPDGRIVSGCCR
ncbi:YbaY family lipoprotein [Schlegelella sp. S2-27]|uniref:YbaY family lipoprotein n=1 Tax=Caldimonas mangrovi TaxID=2944811 RepID=A0ABT0YJS8_9BURK|nr:YbaY family lipoprotein [Caldimonas mangrovi]MCM5678985.1 YbaY family lipoprotein [Caldimonas mangrovi]